MILHSPERDVEASEPQKLSTTRKAPVQTGLWFVLWQTSTESNEVVQSNLELLTENQTITAALIMLICSYISSDETDVLFRKGIAVT